MNASGGYNFPGGDNQDNSWIGWVFVSVIIFYVLTIVGLRLLASR